MTSAQEKELIEHIQRADIACPVVGAYPDADRFSPFLHRMTIVIMPSPLGTYTAHCRSTLVTGNTQPSQHR